MRPIIVLAGTAVREHARRKLVLFFSGGSVLLTGVLVYLVRDPAGGLVLREGTGAPFRLFGLLALLGALAVSMGNIGQPFSSGEAGIILARPLARWQFVLGRVLGSAVIVVGLCVLFTAETASIELARGSGEATARILIHWAIQAFNLAVVAAITTLVSVFVSTPFLAATVGFFANQLLGALGPLHRLVEGGRIDGSVGTLIQALWIATPKFLTSPLQMRGNPARSLLKVDNSIGIGLWAGGYLVALVGVTIILTMRKEA